MGTTELLRRVLREADGDPKHVRAILERTAGVNASSALWIVRRRLRKKPDATRLVMDANGFVEAV